LRSHPRCARFSIPSRGTSAAALLWLALLLLAACSPPPETLSPLPPDGVILAFGDSLTAGTGASASQDFPTHLEALSGRRVINSGRPGEVSAEGLARLPLSLDQHQPDLLILTHGGNDLLCRLDGARTRDNLAGMVEIARERGIDVLLVGVPAPAVLRLRSDGLYAEVAARLGVPLENEALAHILSQEALKADPIHPNAEGYRYLAKRIHELLVQTGAL
jgi:acyl-CoA thioesterase I